jgi:DNA polymerase I
VTEHPFVALRCLLAEVRQLGVTFRISGADVVIDGLDGLPGSLRAALEAHRSSGLLWLYLGGDDGSEAMLALAAQLGVAIHPVSTVAAAKAAVRRLIRDTRLHGGHIGLDIETAPLSGRGEPRPCVRLKKDGGVHAVQPTPKDRTPLDPHQSRIAALQLYAGGTICFVFRGAALELVAGSHWLRRQHLTIHNLGFELAFLRRHTPPQPNVRRRPGRLDCSMQAAGLLLGVGYGGSGRSLERAAEALLNIAMPKALALSDWAAARLAAAQIAYAGIDAIVTWRLWPMLSDQLRQTDRQRAYQIQTAAVPAVVTMEWRGLGFDPAEHARQVDQWSRDLAAARREYHDGTGQAPPSTPAEIRSWLCSVLPANQLNGWPRTDKTGELSTELDHLKRLVHIPSARPVLAMLASAKLLSTFGTSLAEKVNPVTGRLHCHFNIAATKAGRFAASGPNLQQLPSSRAPQFRQCIVAAPGNVLAVCDWSQIELRAAAWISGDRALTDLYRRGGDLHRENAAMIAGVPLDAVTPEQRQAAKPVSFGAIFGIGPASLAEDAFANYGVEMSEAEARHALDTFFARFSQLNQWREDNYQRAQAQGFVRIPGAGRVVEAAWEKTGRLRWPQCCNLPVQGIAADCMLRALALAHARLTAAGVRGGLVATVHDELICECAEADGERALAILQGAMIAAFEATFRGAPSNGVAVAKLGRSWAEAKG